MRAGLTLQRPARELVDDHRLDDHPLDDHPFDDLGPSWIRVDHVPFGATVDIEHVLLARTGISVVTTMGDHDELGHAVTEARWRARKITALLGRVAWVAALPVLLVSELAELSIAGTYAMLDGVLLVRAVDPASWIAHLEAQPAVLDDATIGDMVDVIVAHTQRTDAIVSTYVSSAAG